MTIESSRNSDKISEAYRKDNVPKIYASNTSKYDLEAIWDIANDFSGYSYPITDSWDHDTLLEMKRIAETCGCSLEDAAQIMIDELGFEPEDVDIEKLSGGQDVDEILSACGSKKVESSYDMIPEYDAENYAGGYTEWELVDVKSVKDYDGFWTDYTMWHNPITDYWVCIFGDRDIYYPENADYDWECESEQECREWFDNYVGPGDEDDEDIYMSTDIDDADEDIESGCGSKKTISASSSTYDDLDILLGELGRNISKIRKNVWDDRIPEEAVDDLVGTIHRTNKIVRNFCSKYNI